MQTRGWRIVSIREKYQSDGFSCGVWLQVARDVWLLYVASHQHGMRIFPAFLKQTLETQHGVKSLSGLRNPTKSAAERANEEYILGVRADMRGRLVQAALANGLSWGQANLAGFAPATALDLEEYDDEVPV